MAYTPLTLAQAARLVGKTTRTIRNWRAAGIDVTDENALLNYSDKMDFHARGSSKSRQLFRNEQLEEDRISRLPHAKVPNLDEPCEDNLFVIKCPCCEKLIEFNVIDTRTENGLRLLNVASVE